MNSAGVLGIGATEHLSVKVIYVTVFSGKGGGVPWTPPHSQCTPQGG